MKKLLIFIILIIGTTFCYSEELKLLDTTYTKSEITTILENLGFQKDKYLSKNGKIVYFPPSSDEKVFTYKKTKISNINIEYEDELVGTIFYTLKPLTENGLKDFQETIMYFVMDNLLSVMLSEQNNQFISYTALGSYSNKLYTMNIGKTDKINFDLMVISFYY